MDEDDGGVENIAYAVPAMILQRCLADHLEHAAGGKAATTTELAGEGAGAERTEAGLPMLGLRWQRTESEAMRGALGLPEKAHQGADWLRGGGGTATLIRAPAAAH